VIKLLLNLYYVSEKKLNKEVSGHAEPEAGKGHVINA